MLGHLIGNTFVDENTVKLGFRRIGGDSQWCEARREQVGTVRYTKRRPLLAALRRQP